MFGKTKKRLSLIIIVLGLAVLGACSPKNSGNLPAETVSSRNILSNYEETVDMIRRGMKDYSSSITVTFSCKEDVSESLSQFAHDWIEDAMAETQSPVEGDYIRYQWGGYKTETSVEKSRKGYLYKVKIIPKYYMYLVQEEEVSAKLEEIFREFAFDVNTSDYEKIFRIYDYLCSHVAYDKVHKKNPYYYLRSTSYGAVVQGTATCQGYSVALYRMLKEAGINARIVTGNALGEEDGTLHAWNIAELDGLYYNLDATWDSGAENYEYFLKGEEDFSDHVPKEEFLKEDFRRTYPMAEKSIDWRELNGRKHNENEE